MLTVYSTSLNAFSEEHQRVVEAVSRQVGTLVEHLSTSKSIDKTSPVELPSIDQLHRFTQAIGGYQLPNPTSLLLIGVAAVTIIVDNRPFQTSSY